MNEPIIILSDARTGSTLLRVLLDTYPTICSPGELSLGSLCEQLYYAIESSLGQALVDQSLDARAAFCLIETRRIVDGILQKYCALKGKLRWCEKTPRNLTKLPMLRAVFPDAWFLCLYRHCLDVVASAMAVFGDMRSESLEYLTRYGDRVVPASIERWCDRAERLLKFEAAVPVRSRRVRYEDLVGDPATTLQGILAFVGEAWWPEMIDRVFAAPHDSALGDPKIAGTSRVHADSVGGGRRVDLSEVPPALLERMRRTLAVLGYDEQPMAASNASTSAARAMHTDVTTVVEQLLSARLQRHAHWLRAPPQDLGVIVRGSSGGAWTLRFSASGARFCPPAGTSAVTVLIESSDLLDAVNGRLTQQQLQAKLVMEGNLASLDRPLLGRLVYVLFGQDLRTPAS